MVKTVCAQGHLLKSKSLGAVRQCKGCGEPCSTVYDCAQGCYGKCCDCWVGEHRDYVAPVVASFGEVQ